MTARAFTLLEVLLATNLLAVVMVATVGWTRGQARAAHAAQTRLEAVQALEACARVVEDDLLVAVPGPDGQRWRIDGDTLQVATLDEVPGDPIGAHLVTWRFADGALQRVVAGHPPRVATQRLLSARFIADDARGAMSLVYRVRGRDVDESLPLRVRP